jgi:hypothetical protein
VLRGILRLVLACLAGSQALRDGQAAAFMFLGVAHSGEFAGGGCRRGRVARRQILSLFASAFRAQPLGYPFRTPLQSITHRMGHSCAPLPAAGMLRPYGNKNCGRLHAERRAGVMSALRTAKKAKRGPSLRSLRYCTQGRQDDGQKKEHSLKAVPHAYLTTRSAVKTGLRVSGNGEERSFAALPSLLHSGQAG